MGVKFWVGLVLLLTILAGGGCSAFDAEYDVELIYRGILTEINMERDFTVLIFDDVEVYVVPKRSYSEFVILDNQGYDMGYNVDCTIGEFYYLYRTIYDRDRHKYGVWILSSIEGSVWIMLSGGPQYLSE